MRDEPSISAPITGTVHEPRLHDSAIRHVTGEATYVDDIREPAGLLHLCLGLSEKAHARVLELDLTAVRAHPGVVAVLTAGDVPGVNDISCMGRMDEPLFAGELVEHVGQPLFAVAAETRGAARHAARLARVRYEELPAILDIQAAKQAGSKVVFPPMTLTRGDAAAAIAAAPHRLAGSLAMGGQEHFYLESQAAMAVPGEDGEMLLHVSTQHPSEVQHVVAHILGLSTAAVTVEVRRMGGGFGGKETQANLFAAAAALAARVTGRPAKLRPDRDDDMVVTGKRHDFEVDYTVGFDDAGRILGADFRFAARAGYAADLSGPISDRALFHCDNAYHYGAVTATALPLKTNTQSNTAFRGFGGPQGMVAAERVIEEVAYALGMDPLDVRRANLYGMAGTTTPYHQEVEDWPVLHRLLDQLERDSGYRARRQDIRRFNQASPVLKKGIALTPVKFGISFTNTAYNQAGALLHVYRDGSVQLNHGGTEMGQGLFVKVAQVVASELQIDIGRIRHQATNTGKVPNTSATAASSGSDLNGMAARDAARTVKGRLVAFAAERFGVEEAEVRFQSSRVLVGEKADLGFAELVEMAYQARIQLSATGFYKTPKIHWDRKSGRGRPFYYFAYGASVSEVTIDTLTGEYRVDRVDILHDVGTSLNPAIDVGQLEGGFVQGMGWLTMEELWWDAAGRLRTHSPSTYKIPACSDRPRIFNVKLLEDQPNREETIHRSKAVGEPPVMLAISVLHALSDAVASVADHRHPPRLDAPATPERVLMAVERLKALAPAGEPG
ncbi:xanthine dehydrogenase molybdopterin binding subunit [Indioceanicola profundi]|uniref:xanthine dehydrogenase molybdopterin binding subunit n=1 Tax=Indioceanicola profundi TaxID=2220096 RepID=UPI000E6AAC2F|nr:xanthine dehydrogenase molybdopterin binding subunit [Indioceanicola profundi]